MKYDEIDRAHERRSLAHHKALIYAIAPDSNGPTKIGVSTNISRRLDALQVGCWLPLAPFAFRAVLPAGFLSKESTDSITPQAYQMAAEALEKAALIEVSKMGLRLSGEWCDLTPLEAIQVLEKVAAKKSMPIFGVEDIIDDETQRVPREVLVWRDQESKLFLRINNYCHEIIKKHGLT